MIRQSLLAIVRRDLTAALQHKGQLLQPPMFFIMVSSLFPLAIGPQPRLLAQLSIGVIWVSALLAALLNMRRIFARDFEDGSLEQMLLAPQPLSIIVLGKVFVHWLVACLPLILLAPILALMLNLPPQALPALMLSLLSGTPCISVIGALGAALTVGVKQSSLLLPLMVLPLFVPILILGTAAVMAAVDGFGSSAQLLLTAYLLFAAAVGPWAIATGLKISLSE